MDVINKLGNFAKNVGEKTGDVLETSKLQFKIRNEKSNIDENYKKIGEYIYEKYESNIFSEDDVNCYFDAIKVSNNNIKKYEKEIENIKNTAAFKKSDETTDIVYACPNCGEIVDVNSAMCMKCGHKF